ncbi:hypothetical protein GCM10009864_08830 [Streptomyces lunalinharesii]|uniref:Transposase n=1 Tax=Streptomyces lunalinharesii TaxID=333384 RepID=A0ABP6DSC6_9ACTN
MRRAVATSSLQASARWSGWSFMLSSGATLRDVRKRTRALHDTVRAGRGTVRRLANCPVSAIWGYLAI